MCPPVDGLKDCLGRRSPNSKLDMLSPPTSLIEDTMCKGGNKRTINADPFFVVHIPFHYFILALSLATAFAFTLGSMSRLIFFPNADIHQLSYPSYDDTTNEDIVVHLPSPTVSEGKEVPSTTDESV